MTVPLVLSLFPGIGLLDMAFEDDGPRDRQGREARDVPRAHERNRMTFSPSPRP